MGFFELEEDLPPGRSFFFIFRPSRHFEVNRPYFREIFVNSFLMGLLSRKPSRQPASRYPWVDYAKGIAIVLVVYRHMLGGYESAGVELSEYLLLAQQSVYNFRMPLFFILSGIFVRKSLGKRSMPSFLAYKLNTIMYPYLLWASVQLSVQLLFSPYTNNPRQLSDFLYLFYAPRELDQFWFLYTIFNITMIYVSLYSYVKIKSAGQLVVAAAFYYLSTVEAVASIGLLQDTLQYYLYFALGSYIAEMILDRSRYGIFSSWWLFVLLLPAFLVSQWYWITHQDLRTVQPLLFALIAIVGSSFTFNVAFILGKAGVAALLATVGRHSLYIYILHVLCIGFTRTLLLSLLKIDEAVLLLPISMVVGIVLPIVIYQLSLRHGLWFLFAFRKPLTARIPSTTSAG